MVKHKTCCLMMRVTPLPLNELTVCIYIYHTRGVGSRNEQKRVPIPCFVEGFVHRVAGGTGCGT